MLGLIEQDYYRQVHALRQLVNKGLAAAVASLDDPYSHYYDPSRVPTLRERRTTRT